MGVWHRFQDIQLDVLKEIGNIGAGNAATALSTLLQKPIDMKVPSVKIVSFDEITEIIGGPEALVVAVFLRIDGDIPGCMFFILSKEAADNLLRGMLDLDPKETYSEIESSALQEVANILSGSYLSSLADLTKLNLQPSVPLLAMDMAAALLSYGLIEISKVDDYALLIDTLLLDLTDQQYANITGHFFLLPDPDSFQQLFTALGVPLE